MITLLALKSRSCCNLTMKRKDGCKKYKMFVYLGLAFSLYCFYETDTLNSSGGIGNTNVQLFFVDF